MAIQIRKLYVISQRSKTNIYVRFACSDVIMALAKKPVSILGCQSWRVRGAVDSLLDSPWFHHEAGSLGLAPEK